MTVAVDVIETHRFPEGKRFAFSILDDTDDSTLENVRPVYDRLREYGFRTTKTVWPLDCPQGSRLFYAADTLKQHDYLDYVHELVDSGFELASHGATMESSPREDTLQALEFLKEEFGACPRLYVNHAHNRENLYWGPQRFRTPPLRWLFGKLQESKYFTGEREDSQYFWGDLCRQRFDYVRNFTFSQLNMLRANPRMPYRLSDTPYVRFWFSTTDAPDVAVFRKRITRKSLDQLEQEGGVCIISTHFGKGFSQGGRLDSEVDSILQYLSNRPGWYAPVSEILDHLATTGGCPELGAMELFQLEVRYLLDQLRIRFARR